MSRYFMKELPDRPLILNGTSLLFDYKQLEDGDPLLPPFEACMRKGIGGLVEISQEEFEQGKKKENQTRPTLAGTPREELTPKLLPHVRERNRRGAAVAKPPEPPPVMTPEQQAITKDFTAFKPGTMKGVLK